MWTRGDLPFDTILGKYQVRNILEHAKGGSLLDLGCNEGDILFALMNSNKFESALGVDTDPKKVKAAIARRDWRRVAVETKHMCGDIELACSTIEDFTINEQFNTITLINVLEHVDDPILVLKKAKEWLAPDGVIIIHVPNAGGLNRKLGVKMGLITDTKQFGEQDYEIGHKRFYAYWLLRADILRAELMPLHMGGVFLKPFSNAQMQRIADEWDNAEQIFDGLYELAKEMPEYSSPIWAVCRG